MGAVVDDGVRLGAIVARQYLFELAMQPRGQGINEQQLVQGIIALLATVYHILKRTALARRQGVEHRVFAAMP